MFNKKVKDHLVSLFLSKIQCVKNYFYSAKIVEVHLMDQYVTGFEKRDLIVHFEKIKLLLP